MATLTCSLFLPRKCLVSYLGGEYLLAANGPFIECFDMDKIRCGKYDQYTDLPVKTRVTENSPICHILPLYKSGGVVVITSDYRHSSRTLTAHLLHRELVLSGGYVVNPLTSHLLSREENFVEEGEYADTRAEVISGTDEFVLLTSTFVAHYRYVFSNFDDHDAQFIREQEFDLKQIVTHKSNNGCRLGPSCISPSIPLQFMMKSVKPSPDARYSVYFFRTGDSKLTWREYTDSYPSSVELMIPNLQIGILCREQLTTFVSTSVHQYGVKSNQLKQLVQFENPHILPKRIFVVENTQERKMEIIIVSEEGIMWYRWNGKHLEVFDQEDDERMEVVRDSLGIHQDDNDMLKEVLSHMDGIIDTAIIYESTTNEIHLVNSLKSGKIETRLHLGELENSLMRDVSTSSPLSGYNSLITTSTSSKDIYIHNRGTIGSQISSIISIRAQKVHWFDIDRKGTVNRKPLKSIDIPTSVATCSDVDAGPSLDSSYILIGCAKGEVYVQILKIGSDPPGYVIQDEKTKILSVRFFRDKITGNSPTQYAVLTNFKLRVFQVSSFHNPGLGLPSNTKILYEFNIDKPKEWKYYNMLTMGDGTIIHDVWLLFDDIVYLIIGRKKKLSKIITMKLRRWKGAITASSAISTKKKEEDSYLDIITIAKRSKI
ncbi:hypothetical protein PENTCL1PPCAC_23061, partial [Pristionchus entomophagus]